jgi:hypothetical protein
MPELSINDIEKISTDIKKEEITFSHLLEDLIDHVCCDVENEMAAGLSFIEAYGRVRKKIGSRRLKEIQEETLFQTDSKYRKMKTTMKIAGIAGTILFGLSALFKIQHWQGAGIMMTLGAIILAFIFLPSALVVLWKETHNAKKLFLFISSFFAAVFFILGTLFKIQHWPGAAWILSLAAFSAIFFFLPAIMVHLLSDPERKSKRGAYIVGAIGFVLYLCGMLFKIQHWPLATLLNTSGMALIGAIALPWYTWKSWKMQEHITAKFLYIIIGLLLIVMPGALLNLSLQYSYEDYFYPNLGRQQALNDCLLKDINAKILNYSDSAVYPKIEQLHSRTAAILGTISSIEVKMVQESEGKPGNPAISPAQVEQTEIGPEIRFTMLTKPFLQAPVQDLLLPACPSRQKLDIEVREYVKYVSDLIPGDDIQKFLGLLNSSDYLPGDQNEKQFSMMSGLHSLEILKGNLLTMESYFISTILKTR